MNLAVALETQPDFPAEDLTESNAQLLELMLANSSIVEATHLEAEKISLIYRVGHPAMRQAGNRLDHIEKRLDAFSHGVSTYETIAALISSRQKLLNRLALSANAIALTSSMDENKLADYIYDATEHFSAETPLAAAVVGSSSERFYRNIACYAVYGAALARQFEIDGTDSAA